MVNKFMEEPDALNKEYKDPVDFVIGTGADEITITWTPGDNLVSNLSSDTTKGLELARAAEDYIQDLYNDSINDYISVTPVGPFLAGKQSDLPTVVYVLNFLYGDLGIEVVGEAPTMADMVLDDSTNVDEDGNTVVR
jgi:hypothetical protein